MIDQGAVISRRGFCAAGASALGMALFGGGRAAAQAPAKVKFGLVSSLFRDYPAFLVLPVLTPFKEYVEGLMAAQSVLSEGGAALELGRKIDKGEQHLGVFHGVEFAWAKQKYPKLQPLFIAVNGVPSLSAHLIVRKAAGFTGIEDLEGKTLRTAGRGREHCYLFLERSCVPPGTPYRKYYKVTRANETAENLDALAAGRTASVLADGIDWETYKKESPTKAAKLTPLVSSVPLPCALVAHDGGTLAPALLAAFRIGMLRAHRAAKGKAALDVMRITHFANVPDDFDDQLTAAAKAYPAPLT
jgi:hypothetical protein